MSCCVAVETQGSILQGGAPGKHKVEGIGVSFIPKTFDRTHCRRDRDDPRRASLCHGQAAGAQ